MNEIQKSQNSDIVEVQDMTIENRLEIIEEGLRKKYLSRLMEIQIAPVKNLAPLEEDLIDNVRLYHIKEMVYQKGQPAADKFTTVFNTLSTYNASVFIIIDSDSTHVDFYIGVRNNETDVKLKRSTVTLGDTLKNTLIGHFPGIKIKNEDRIKIGRLSEKIRRQHNVTSVSVVGSRKGAKDTSNDQFVQGLEKLALAMQGRQYIGIIVAENQPSKSVQAIRKEYQELYTKLSPYQKVQFSENTSDSTSRSKSFMELTGKQKAAMVGSAAFSLAGAIGGAVLGRPNNSPIGAMIGSQVAGQLNSFISSLAPTEQITKSTATTTSTTTENKAVTDLLRLIDDTLNRTSKFDSYGMWNVAGYFMSDDMSTAEIAASNYRSLMNGEDSGHELSAINSWRSNNPNLMGDFGDLYQTPIRFADYALAFL